MAWTYIPADEFNPERWVDYSNPGFPLVSNTDPAKGFANKNAALESLYLPVAGGNMSQLQSLVASNPTEYAKYGITPENAASMVDSTFYDRIHNIDNDPLNFLNNLAFLPHAMGLANVFTGGGVDSFLNNTFGGGSGPVASGGMPTQVGGWSAEMPNWWETDWGAEGLVDLGSSGYNAVASNDPIGALIKNLESGMTPSEAVSAVEASLPGTTRSSLEQFLYGVGSNASSLGGKLLSGLSGGDNLSGLGSLLGKLLPAGLGMYASNQQTNALKDLANKYSEYGAPYRSQLAEISADPSKFYNSTAAQKGVDTVLNKLSIGGNPSGSPYKQQLAVDSLWNDYGRERDRLAGFGGLTNYNASAPNIETQAVNSQGNMYNALGAGLNDIFNPKTSLADLLRIKP